MYVVKTKEALISCVADLGLCFCICKNQVFSCMFPGTNVNEPFEECSAQFNSALLSVGDLANMDMMTLLKLCETST